MYACKIQNKSVPRGAARRDPGGQRATASAQGSALVCQRALHAFKQPAVPNVDQAQIAADAATIDGFTNAVYPNVWQAIRNSFPPTSTPLTAAMFPNTSAGRVTNLVNALNAGNVGATLMAIGYVIESEVSGAVLPAGTATQVPVGNAIPDFVITHNAERGILDLTSTGQLGHVLKKDFAKGPFPYIAETVYPSVNYANITGGAAGPPAVGGGLAAAANLAQRNHANAAVRSGLSKLKTLLDLYVSGVYMGDNAFGQRAVDTKTGINLILGIGAVWTGAQVQDVDDLIDDVNVTLAADGQPSINTLSDIIDAARDDYLLAGNPVW
ncbi:consensus disorder prediction [Desulfoluna spongiiphila]|nr:consensus disorder prediction [Desulfoluna spongiiphila]